MLEAYAMPVPNKRKHIEFVPSNLVAPSCHPPQARNYCCTHHLSTYPLIVNDSMIQRKRSKPISHVPKLPLLVCLWSLNPLKTFASYDVHYLPSKQLLLKHQPHGILTSNF